MVDSPARTVDISGMGVFSISSGRLAEAMIRNYRTNERLRKMVEEGNYVEERHRKILNSCEYRSRETENLKKKFMKIDFKGIMEGVKNSIFIKDQVEKIAAERLMICCGCSKNSNHQKKFAGYRTFRPDYHCTECGCDLHLKTRAMSASCPINKWTAQLSEQEEHELKKKIDEQGET